MWHGVLFYIQGWSSSLRSFVWRVDIRSPYTLDYPTDYLRSRLLRKSWRFGLSNICWQNIFMCWSVSSRVKTRITKERNLQYVAVMNLRPRNVSTKWSLFNISFGQVTRFSILVGCLNCFLLHGFFSFCIDRVDLVNHVLFSVFWMFLFEFQTILSNKWVLKVNVAVTALIFWLSACLGQSKVL